MAGLAEAAGIEIEERNLVRRESRSRWLYLLAAAATLPTAFLAGRWGFNAYASTGSSLEGNAIAIFYGMTLAVALGGIGLTALILAVTRRLAAPLRWIVAHTFFGRLAPPPDGVVERARLLIPDLDKGASK